MKKVKGFSFDTIKDQELLIHLNNQSNQSGYIKGLIRKDIDNSNIESVVERLIQQYLKGKIINNNNNNNINNVKTNNNHNEIDIDSALACMNIH